MPYPLTLNCGSHSFQFNHVDLALQLLDKSSLGKDMASFHRTKDMLSKGLRGSVDSVLCLLLVDCFGLDKLFRTLSGICCFITTSCIHAQPSKCCPNRNCVRPLRASRSQRVVGWQTVRPGATVESWASSGRNDKDS